MNDFSLFIVFYFYVKFLVLKALSLSMSLSVFRLFFFEWVFLSLHLHVNVIFPALPWNRRIHVDDSCSYDSSQDTRGSLIEKKIMDFSKWLSQMSKCQKSSETMSLTTYSYQTSSNANQLIIILTTVMKHYLRWLYFLYRN